MDSREIAADCNNAAITRPRKFRNPRALRHRTCADRAHLFRGHVIVKGAPMPGTTDPSDEDALATDSTLREILRDVLGLSARRVDEFDGETGLFGHLPELDSMTVATLLTEIEDRLDILIDDDEVDGEMLETYGALLAFVEGKIGES